jgi:glutathione S-transferase
MNQQPMIKLYGFGPYLGMPDGSPYVMKAEILLRMAGLAYAKHIAGPDQGPKGKLPYVDDAGEIVADTSFIRSHVARKYGVDFDAGLDPVERAEAWAIERMIEDHLYWCCLHMRWGIEENFRKGPAHFFDRVPEPMRDKVREASRAKVLGYLQAQGIGRHTPDEIAELGGRTLESLSALLGQRDWLMGERPCGSDAAMTGMLATLLNGALDSPLRQIGLARANLAAYIDRAVAHFFPEHDWQPVARKAQSAALAFA